jgi:hypothetical protein
MSATWFWMRVRGSGAVSGLELSERRREMPNDSKVSKDVSGGFLALEWLTK